MREAADVLAVHVRSRSLGRVEAITCGLRRLVVRAIAVVFVTVAAASLVGRAEAFVYWTETTLDAIGRANSDGSGVNVTFIRGLNGPKGMAIDGTYIYYVTSGGGIGRANLDGTGVDATFILGVFPVGLAVDGAHIYWTTSGPNGNRIGRADLNGTGVNPSFITTVVAATGVAVDGTYVYWTNSGLNAIGRANVLDGSGANQLWIKGAENPQGLAVDGHYIYWANANSGTIARADLNGTGANEFFISGAKPEWVAVDGAHIWWTNGSPLYAIGRAGLDGMNVSQQFVSTLSAPAGVAVNTLVAPSPGPGSTPPTITRLIDDVQELGLPRGTQRSLLAKLGAAQGNVDAGELEGACDSLGAFINEVHALTDNRIDGDIAAELVADATAVRQLLSCGAD